MDFTNPNDPGFFYGTVVGHLRGSQDQVQNIPRRVGMSPELVIPYGQAKCIVADFMDGYPQLRYWMHPRKPNTIPRRVFKKNYKLKRSN